MWRYGFKNPPNFNDHELYCGGFTRLWQTNRGKCGICGDPYDEPQVKYIYFDHQLNKNIIFPIFSLETMKVEATMDGEP